MATALINTQSALDPVIADLNKKDRIALDLEFDKNYYRFGFNLCLVQIYDGTDCYLIDPLSEEIDISTLFPVFENSGIEKVTFAFGEDIRLLHSLGCFPKNIYDLDITTSLLNYPPGSLTKLINDVLNVDTGKSSQTSNWYKRPLTDQQKHYAAQDVLHLLDLKEILAKEAEDKNITSWIEEENLAWDLMDYSDVDNNEVIKEKDKNDLTEVEWYIYKNLIEYRESLAKEHNKPGFKIIRKQFLSDVAQNTRVLMRFERDRGINPKLKTEEVKQTILDIATQARTEAEKQGLSDTETAFKSPTEEEKQIYRKQKSLIDKLKFSFFNPIKKKITEDYGEETAIFLFSNRIIAEIVAGSFDEIEAYKLDLLKKYSEELNLDIQEYTDLVNGD
ncbi:MAG: ribonuclease D [Balneolaceae bacterium]